MSSQPPKARPGRKPTNAPPATARQAQVRAAQKAFLERKKQHVETLEAKVASLESRLASAEAENAVLRGLLVPAGGSRESVLPTQNIPANQFQPPTLPVSNLSGSGFDVSLSWEQMSQLLQSLTVQNPIQQPTPAVPLSMDLDLDLNTFLSSVQTSASTSASAATASVGNGQATSIPTDPFEFIVPQQPYQIQAVVAQQQQLMQTLSFSQTFSIPSAPSVASFDSDLTAVPALASTVSPPATSPAPSSTPEQQRQRHHHHHHHEHSHHHGRGGRGRSPGAFASKLTFRVNFIQSSLKSVPSLRREEAENQIDRMMSLLLQFKTAQFAIMHTGNPPPSAIEESKSFLQSQLLHSKTEFRQDTDKQHALKHQQDCQHGPQDNWERRHRPHHFYESLDIHDHEAWARAFPETLGLIWKEMQDIRGGLLRICDEQDGRSVLSILDRRHHPLFKNDNHTHNVA
ncbi:hypothetical protein HDU82_007954 [Entophlyctis luteolus]|nr:hypothetical protein HDU82_007954 [Entophlyctis luteolus]